MPIDEKEISTEEMILELFFARKDNYAVQRAEGSYVRIESPVTPELIEKHLDGEVTLGSYVMSRDGQVKFICFDLDAEGDLASSREAMERLASALESLGIHALREFSGSKGFHTWVFLDEMLDAEVAVSFMRTLLASEGWEREGRGFVHPDFPGVVCETFPKSASAGEAGCGPLIKLPIGIHRKSGNRSYFLDEDGREIIPFFKALRDLPRPGTAQAVRDFLSAWAPRQEDGDLVARLKREISLIDLFGLLTGESVGHKGGRTITVRCPFPGHEDLHPSFTIYPTQNRFVCGVCGSGDMIDFYARIKGLDVRRDFKTILRGLCDMAGIPYSPGLEEGPPPPEKLLEELECVLEEVERLPDEGRAKAVRELDMYRRLAELDNYFPVEAHSLVKRLAKALGTTQDCIRREMGKYAPSPQTEEGPAVEGRTLLFEDPEPWPEPVSGCALLEEIAQTFRRFLILPEGAAEALSLWAVFTHVHDCFHVSPRLAITSPTKRCGKSRVREVLSCLVARPLLSENASAAATFRVIDQYHPTLLFDEVEYMLREGDERIGILNGGTYGGPGGSRVLRTVGEKHKEVRAFPIWAPISFCLIGSLSRISHALADRCIEIRMERKKRDEAVERFRLGRTPGKLLPLKRKIVRWAEDKKSELAQAEPDLPGELNDREQDLWEPLLAIADAAGGEWPERARRAALILCGRGEVDEEDVKILLLNDLHDLFLRKGAESLSTSEILEDLNEMEERPWGGWHRGKELTARGLADLLRPFKIRPCTIREGNGTFKGYRLEDFSEAFERYLKPQESENIRHAVTSQVEGQIPSITSKASVTDGKQPLSWDVTVLRMD